MPFLILMFALAFGFAGYKVAQSKGKDPMMWALICGVTGFVGLTILLVAKSDDANAGGATQHYAPSAPAPVPALARDTPNYDVKRWQTLIEVDPDIAHFAARARQNGPETEAILAEKYLTLQDKSYLESAYHAAVKSVVQQHEARLAVEQEERSRFEADLVRLNIELNSDRSAGQIVRHAGTSKFVENHGGYVIVEGPYNGKRFEGLKELVRFFS